MGTSHRFDNNTPHTLLHKTDTRASTSVLETYDEDHKKTLQELNTRLVSYVEKVRKLQMATDVIDSMPKYQGKE